MLCQSSPTVRSLPYHPFNSDGGNGQRGMNTPPSNSASSSRRSSSSGTADSSSSTITTTVQQHHHHQQQQQQHQPQSQRPPSPQPQPHQSASTSARPRHHSRSVSQEASRFPSVTSFNLSPPRRPSHGSNGTHSLKMSISQTLPPAPSPASTATPPSASASSLSDSPSVSGSSTSTETSPDQDDDQGHTVSPASSIATSSAESSPTAVRSNTSALPADDESRLKALLEAQASRRPRLLRLTPAYASMPGRIQGSSIPQTGSATGSAKGEERGVPFPTKDSSGSASSSGVVDQLRGQLKTPPLEPPSGLLLDLSNLPGPSKGDASAPQSTSEIPAEVRTKSGRLIKPALRNSSFTGGSSGFDYNGATSASHTRAKSTPNTPSVAKVVQFDSQLEHVKVFKFKQKPTAISRSGSPEQTETETEEERELFPFVNYGRKGPSPPSITPTPGTPNNGSASGIPPVEEQLVLRLPNFPSSARLSVDKVVFLERIYLAEDLRSVKGTVRVRNISFEKWVAVRFTLDNWVTVNEVSAEYSESLADGSADRFSFSIKLNELLDWPRGAGQHETKTMFLCLRYTTCDGEHWDNNDGLNYQLDFRKRQLPSTPMPTPNATRPTTRAQTISGPMSTQQARVIDMVRRHGVQAGKGGGFVEVLRRELDKLKSDEEDADRLPIFTKKMVAAAAVAAGGNPGGPVVNLKQKRSTTSPPGSPGHRIESSPMWSARYDWNESLRNSASSNSRNRPAVFDYFNSRPPPPASAMGAADAGGPQLYVSAASPPSQTSSAAATPTVSSFGQTRAGMLSPAVGDVFAHHQPTGSTSMSSSLASSVETSVSNSASNSPDRLFAAALGIAAGREGRMSPGGGNSPTSNSPSARFHSFPPHRKGNISPLASGQTSLENSDSDEEEDQVEDARISRAVPTSRIVTMPRSSIKTHMGAKKADGLVLENYDSPPIPSFSPFKPAGSTPPIMVQGQTVSTMGSLSSESTSLFSPSTSVSSMESETSELITPEDATAGLSIPNYTFASLNGVLNDEDNEGRGIGGGGSGNGGSSDHSSDTPLSTPRLVSRQHPPPPPPTQLPTRRWSPPRSSIISTADQGLAPSSAVDLSELISKYCWSSESVPGLGLVAGVGSDAGGGTTGNGSRSRTSSPLGVARDVQSHHGSSLTHGVIGGGAFTPTTATGGGVHLPLNLTDDGRRLSTSGGGGKAGSSIPSPLSRSGTTTPTGDY